MKPCGSCERAEVNPKTGRYSVGCFNCECRAMAHSQSAKDAMLGHPQALQAALRGLFKTPEKYKEARVLVYSWINRLS